MTNDDNMTGNPLDFQPPPAPTMLEQVLSGKVEATPMSLELPTPSSPLPVAHALLEAAYTKDGLPTLGFWRGDWWRYTGTQWAIADDLEMDWQLYTLLGSGYYMKPGDGADDQPEPCAWNPTRAKVTNVMDPLKALSNKRVADTVDAPMWLQPTKSAAKEYVPLRNGLLHLPTREVVEHSPALFSTYCLPFDYQPGATCPTWDTFLGQVFAHDPAAALMLQEAAGYIISGRTDLHKGFLLIGPPRAGKGVISHTLKELVGVANTHSPKLKDFGDDFGLESMVDKVLGVVEDARGDVRGNSAAVEGLLNITGEDQVSINRKHRTYWTGTLPTRLMLFSNEVPRFMDASGAVVTRFMAVKLEQSFLGREDPTLKARISEELAGVFNWALEGLERLEEQGKFTVPATMDDMLQQMKDAAAPATTFLEEHYQITGEESDRVELSVVHARYKVWCEEQGMKFLAQLEFIRRVNDGGSGATVKNEYIDAPGWAVAGKRKRKRFVLGIKDE